MPPQYNLPTASEKNYYWLCLSARKKPLEQLSEEVSQYETDRNSRRRLSLLKRIVGHFTYDGHLNHEEYQLSRRILKERLTGETEPTTSDVMLDGIEGGLKKGFKAWKNYPINLFIAGYKEARHSNTFNFCKYKALDLGLKTIETLSTGVTAFYLMGGKEEPLYSIPAALLSGMAVLGLRNGQLTDYLERGGIRGRDRRAKDEEYGKWFHKQDRD